MLWDAINLLINFVEIYLVYYFLSKFYERRINNKWVLFLLLLVQTVILSLTNEFTDKSSLLGISINIICISLINILIFREFFMNIIAPVLIWLILLGVVESVVVYTMSIGFNVPPNVFGQNNVYKLMAATITRIALLFFINRVYKITIVSKGLKKVYLYQMIMILMFNLPLMLVLPNMLLGNIEVSLSALIVILIVFIASISIVKLFNVIMQYASKEAEYDTQVQYIRNMNEFIQQLRAQRHDFNHHIGCIYGLLERDKVDEVRDYIEQLIQKTEELNALINTNNPYVTAILNHKLNIARENGINLEIDVDMPDFIITEPIDLSIILGNILDNAIEACQKVTCYRFIDIKIKEDCNYLLIYVRNPKSEHVKNEDRKTTKKDKDNHGFGLKNIELVVKKYKGKIEISESDDEFAIKILLNNLK